MPSPSENDTSTKQYLPVGSSKSPDLMKELVLTLDPLKSRRLMKYTWEELITSDNFKKALLQTSLSLAAGYVARRVAAGLLRSPVALGIGTAVLSGVSAFVARNPTRVKNMGHKAFSFLKSKKSVIEDSGAQNLML